MKLPEKRFIFINGTFFVGTCLLTTIALLSPQSGTSVTVALIAAPVLLLLSISISTWIFLREIRLRKMEMEMLRHAVEGQFPGNDIGQSGELIELLMLLREENSRIHRILTDHGETSTLVGMNLERVIRLTDRMALFIGDVDKLASKIQHLYQRIENSLLQADKQEDLSETILKIRFELDHFNEAPSSMLNLLKKVYSSCRQNREAFMAAQEGFLGTQSVMAEGEISIILKQQETVQQINNSVQNLEETLQNGETALQSGEKVLREITARFLSFSSEMSEVQGLANKLPEQIHSLSALITELEDVHEKSKILALNAAIYAGDSGEEGKGFSTIAREMKTITESAEILQHQLQQGLNQLEKTILHTIGGMAQLIATQNSIEKFSQEGQEIYNSNISNQNTARKTRDILSHALHRLEEFLDSHEKTARERQNNLARTMAAARKSQQESEDERTLKFQIDNMVIESAHFSEKIENELPNLLDAVGGILDEVSAFQDQFLQIRNTLSAFTDPGIIQTLKELKQAIGGNEIQLLRASTNLLRKMKTNIPSN
ncbi:MAG: hypothetical protein GXO70_02340 [Acidobacteria bacterium]|nr:hypothetical protein [Acidobacteriota bacterium]